MVSKLLVSLNDEQAEDDEAGDNEVEESAWVPGEVSFRLPSNFGQPLTKKKLWSALSYHELGSALAYQRSQRQAFIFF